jgi:hypothetical protein
LARDRRTLARDRRTLGPRNFRQLTEDSWTVPGVWQAALGWHGLCEGLNQDRPLCAGGRWPE